MKDDTTADYSFILSKEILKFANFYDIYIYNLK
jgi:hypothetical protein